MSRNVLVSVGTEMTNEQRGKILDAINAMLVMANRIKSEIDDPIAFSGEWPRVEAITKEIGEEWRKAQHS